jgi:hypothetical protein
MPLQVFKVRRRLSHSARSIGGVSPRRQECHTIDCRLGRRHSVTKNPQKGLLGFLALLIGVVAILMITGMQTANAFAFRGALVGTTRISMAEAKISRTAEPVCIFEPSPNIDRSGLVQFIGWNIVAPKPHFCPRRQHDSHWPNWASWKVFILQIVPRIPFHISLLDGYVSCGQPSYIDKRDMANNSIWNIAAFRNELD